jgi:hypothetical protein
LQTSLLSFADRLKLLNNFSSDQQECFKLIFGVRQKVDSKVSVDDFENGLNKIKTELDIHRLESQVEGFALTVQTVVGILSDSLALHQTADQAKQNKLTHLQNLV